jgi:hypothetical protein
VKRLAGSQQPVPLVSDSWTLVLLLDSLAWAELLIELVQEDFPGMHNRIHYCCSSNMRI